VPTPTSEELAAACLGERVSWAAPYAGKVHPLVIVSEDSDGSYSIDPALGINKNWRDGKWKSPIQLVVCAPDPQTASVRVGSCGRHWKRTDGVVGELLRYRYKSRVRVVVAQTARTLQSTTLYGSAPTCSGGKYSSLDLGVDPPWRKYGLAVTAAQVNKYATTVSKQAVKK
jgi:hypothetical protein